MVLVLPRLLILSKNQQ